MESKLKLPAKNIYETKKKWYWVKSQVLEEDAVI